MDILTIIILLLVHFMLYLNHMKIIQVNPKQPISKKVNLKQLKFYKVLFATSLNYIHILIFFN